MKNIAKKEEHVENGHEQEWLEATDAEQLRQFILQSDDRPEELIEVPLWKVKILVRAMSGSQRALYEANPRDPETGKFQDLRHVYFEVIRFCCVHPLSKKPVFKVADEGTFMDERNGQIIDMLAAKAIRLSGLFPTQQESVRKNLPTTQTSSTTIGLQKDSGSEESK